MNLGEESVKLHEEHRGKLNTHVPFDIETIEDLAVAYTPGVAEPCRVIDKDPERVFDLTIKGHTVAVITDGTAVLGLGNIGPEASLPVMEGKCALFKRFGGLDAFPIALKTLEVEEIIETVKRIAPVFGGINLEDISAPRCFEIERRLVEELDIPVMHDDQHGTAIVILAGLINALKVVGKEMGSIKVVISGAGAAGIAAAHILAAAGVKDIVVMDSRGALVEGRENMNKYKEEVVKYNTRGVCCDLVQAIQGADVFIGLSQPKIMNGDMVASMADSPIVFAMSNPEPEIMPEVALAAGAAVVATGMSGQPNQINNVLAFPGIFKGALEVRAKAITQEMKLAAARGIADMVKSPTADKIIPDAFEQGLSEVVAEAVKKHA